jgi:hypothetical protein
MGVPPANLIKRFTADIFHGVHFSIIRNDDYYDTPFTPKK